MAGQFKHKTASVFQMRLVLDTPSVETESMTNEFQNNSSDIVRSTEMLNVQKTVLLDQSAVLFAKSSKNRLGCQEIEITFTDAGRKQFADITRQHIHERLAMVIDGRLLAAPVIQAEITEGKAEITGTFSEVEAKTLTAKINQAIAH
jgi:preprotein translocase subunit SecD